MSETRYNMAQPTCPHCGHEMDYEEMGSNTRFEGSDGDDLWGLAPMEQLTKVVCPAILCGKPYFVQGGYTPKYTCAVTESEL